MLAAIPKFTYKTLFSAIQKLYEAVQAAASARGIPQQPASGTTPCTTSRKQDASLSQSTFFASGALPGVIFSSAKCSELDTPSSAADTALPTIVGMGGVSVAAGLCVLVGALALGFGNSFAFVVVVVPVGVVLALAASWLVVWGLLEVNVLFCVSRLRRLVTGLHLQQKIAREAVRWAQELEVTFKAFSAVPAEPQQPRFPAAKDFSGDTKSEEPLSTPSCKQAKPPVHASASSGCGSLHPVDQNSSKSPSNAQFQGQASSGRCRVVDSLCSRLCQLFMWEEHVMNIMYDAILRPTGGAQDSWQKLVSRGPWLYGQTCASGKAEQNNNNVRALKDACARSWAVHARLSAGLQVAVRRLLFFLEARLHREPNAMLKHRRSVRVREPQTDSSVLSRGPSRTLRQALVMQRQQHARNNHNENSATSLGDEVAQATLTEGASTVCVHAAVSDASGKPRIKTATTSAPLAHEGEHQRKSRECASSHDQQASFAPLREDVCAEKSFRFLDVVLKAFSAFRAVVDGVAAAWWLQRQLSELSRIIQAAGEVAETAANVLWTTLEEEWTLCFLPPSQPPRIWGLFGERQKHNTSRDLANESLRQSSCSASSPSSSSQPFSSLKGSVSLANRIALASMSRHIGASLALLRLPSMASFSASRQKGILSCPHRGESDPDAEGSQLNSPEDKGTTNAGDLLQLPAFLQLSLRHLRIACEEAERLQQSLRRPVQKRSVVCSQTPKRIIKDDSTQEVDAPQQGPAEPPRCFEVYTAVGQDCINNRLKYKEEAALLADFADEDPAIRERSAPIFRELEVRLQTHQEELQSMPLVLKEFSASGPLTSADKDQCDKEYEGAIRIVKDERLANDMGLQAAHGCKAEETSASSEAAVEHSIAPSEAEAGYNVGYASPQTDVDLVDETPNSLSSCMREEDCNEYVADESSQLSQQVLCGSPANCASKDSEVLAARSLMSELRGLLTDQQASFSAKKRHYSCFTSGAKTSGEQASAKSSGGSDDGECVSSVNSDLGDEEEWEACELQGLESRSPCNSE
ncbi:hypothetical protein Emed_001316 [Eimeria media]